tara:strand:+ start:473 stop:727 length:255 start_codon:yes stop_codon:yes gene_type:complete
MAIKEEEQKKNGMKIVDNMDGMKNATEKLNMKVADITDKMTLSEIREYLRRVEKGESVKDLLENKNIKKIELDQLQKLADKQTS